MVRHYNPTIVERAQGIFNTKGENISDDVSGIVAVVPIRPITRIMKDTRAVTSGSNTTYTTPTDKDFFLDMLSLTVIKDAACDIATGRIAVTVTPMDGTSREILSIPVITLTAQEINIVLPFPNPVLLARGSTIALSGTYAAGVMLRTLHVYGYTEETTRS